MRKFVKIAAYSFFLLLFLAFAASAAFGFWVYTGPRSLNAYIPDIEKAASKSIGTHHAKIGSASLAWGGLQDFVFVKLDNVKLIKNGGKTDLVAKEVNLNFDFLKLLIGKIEPASVVMRGANIDLTNFMAAQKQSGNIGITEAGIENSKVFVPQFKELWDIKKAKLHFGLLRTRIGGDIALNQKENISFKLAVNTTEGFCKFRAELKNFDTSRLKQLGIEGINIVASGGVKGKIEHKKLQDIEASNLNFSGTIESPELLRSKLTIKHGHFDGSYVKSGSITANRITLEFDDGFKLQANGNSASGLEVAFENMKVNNLYKYWPQIIGQNAIAWIKPHITGGTLHSGKAIIKGKKLDFNFNYSGISLDYASPLLPVKNISGSAHMNEHSLNMNIAGAALGSSKLSKTNVLITEIGGKLEKIAINGVVTGAVKDLADFYIKVNKRRGKSTMFASTADVAGGAVSKVSLHFPLLSALRFDEVGIKIDSTIAKASAAKIANNMNLNLKLDDRGYSINGQGNINYLGENFKITNAPSTYKVTDAKGVTNISLNADLAASELFMPLLGAHKPVGEAATLALDIKNNNIEKLDISSKSFKLSGSWQIDANKDIKVLNITNFESNKTKLSGTVKTTNGLEANINATTLNTAPIIEYAHSKRESQDDSRVVVNLTAKEALFKYDIKSNNVSLESDCAKTCSLFKFSSPDITLFKSPTVITAAAKNAGRALKMLDAYEFMKDGSLAINAKATTPENYVGTLRINDFYIIKGKVLTKILTLGSLTGIVDMLQGNGIYFKKLKGDFSKNGDVITLENFTMYGSAIGITAEGTIDLKTNQVKIKGSIIPSYTANTLLGKIPVLGAIVGGDDGMFAFTYSLKGNLDDPQISVNPLSVLAPGFLKGIFQ